MKNEIGTIIAIDKIVLSFSFYFCINVRCGKHRTSDCIWLFLSYYCFFSLHEKKCTRYFIATFKASSIECNVWRLRFHDNWYNHTLCKFTLPVLYCSVYVSRFYHLWWRINFLARIWLFYRLETKLKQFSWKIINF